MSQHVIISGLLLLAFVAPAFAQAPASVCDKIAAELRASPAIPSGGPQDLVDQLGNKLNGAYRKVPESSGTDLPWKGFDRQAFSKQLVSTMSISPDLAGDFGHFLKLPNTDVTIFTAAEGTAHCMLMVGVHEPREGSLQNVPIPIAQGEAMLCGTYISTAQIGDTPALVLEEDGAFTADIARSDLTVVPWRNGRFESPCSLIVSFEIGYSASHAFCDHLDCVTVARTAETLAARLTAGETPERIGSDLIVFGGSFPRQLAAVKAAASLAYQMHDVPLPTFGAPFYSAYSTMGSGVAFPVQIDGELLLARAGHGQLGWRESPDYLVALYRVDGINLVPVAGIVAAAERRFIAKVEVK